MCTVNDFIFACSFIFYLFYFILFVKNHLRLVTSEVIICTGYTIFEIYFEFMSVHIQNNSKNKCLVKVKVLAVCLLG